MEELKSKQKKEIKEFDRDKRIALKKVKASAGKGKKGKEKLEEAEKEWDVKYQSLLSRHKEELSSVEASASASASPETPSTATNENTDSKNDKGEEQQQESAVVQTLEPEQPQAQTQPQPQPQLSAKEKALAKRLRKKQNALKKEKEEQQQESAVVQTLEPEQPQPQPQLSAKEKALAKRLRKKQNALKKEKEREEQIANEVANAPNPRQIEIDTMKELYLNPKSLTIEEVAADGNCLYRAVGRQLDRLSTSSGNSSSTNNDYTNMRVVCADQLMKGREEYEPFTNLTEYNVNSYEEYVGKVRGSSEWGGHVELRALSTALQKTIVVYSAESSPLFITNDDGGANDAAADDDDNNVIRLSFHRKYYALGEHYNSVVPSRSN
eukprot:CAMPEP_0203683308 /NCGR_PEP_ID=MMETSP0090-20130426/47456_1 /ASSEMBLY_ACC=CAM_ASM_001088 /TAXON_ID=426623 /ORGANISM="Chaetoceros affinis, Strain CCMP159" /LENGTH=380 /DNA_ID=CAMNT_0050552449 /DNA_START=79 /DNA_END=1221 /DNA_ORIENTATION=+